MKNEIILFENQNVELEVNLKDETVWLSLEQMSRLFDRNKSVISRHIKNILMEELDTSTVANFATVQNEGERKITRKIDYYSLDMIISIGYRVKSKNGITFRKWANKVLKEYLIKGYAINNKRLEYLEKTVKLIDIASRISDNNSDANGIIKVINKYAAALKTLDDYDHNRIPKSNGIKNDKKITYEGCIKIIDKLKINNNSDLFALERNKGLAAIIGNIYQSYNGKDLYLTVEEKAANFLYLVTKNHVFIDGNKRIAATLFVYFLNFYSILYKNDKQVIDNNTLVAITLLIAQSNPKEKEILIDLLMNFLKGSEPNE